MSLRFMRNGDGRSRQPPPRALAVWLPVLLLAVIALAIWALSAAFEAGTL